MYSFRVIAHSAIKLFREQLRTMGKTDEQIFTALVVLRTELTKQASTCDTVRILSFGKFCIIKYVDYNNFDWNLAGISDVVMGSLRDKNTVITKIGKGILLVPFDGDEFDITIHSDYFEWDDVYGMQVYGHILLDICYNIFQYEYIRRDKQVVITEEEPDQWRVILD